jgi:hypothetical protein
MPIGKNSIKRVANNGYSKVESKAPDMENSTVAEPQEKKPATKKATTAKKPAVKATEAKKPAATKKPAAAKKPEMAKPAAEKEEARDGYINIGRELPIYLL